jgi:hypothetical protein
MRIRLASTNYPARYIGTPRKVSLLVTLLINHRLFVFITDCFSSSSRCRQARVSNHLVNPYLSRLERT